MKVLTYSLGELGANCYIVYDENSKNGLIIDLGGDFSPIERKINALKLNIGYALFTHGHIDHVYGASQLKQSGIKVCITEKDSRMLQGENNLADMFCIPFESTGADLLLEEKEYDFDGIKVRVIFTPGHTAGSCCFLIDGKLFSGDTLFNLTYGRYDFPTGNFNTLKKSINEKLFVLDDETVVYSGHEGTTTIGYEKKYNPINSND